MVGICENDMPRLCIPYAVPAAGGFGVFLWFGIISCPKTFCVVVVEESLTSLESLAQSGGVVVSNSRLVVVY